MKDYAKLRKLSDDDLMMVSGGCGNNDGDNTVCEWNPDGTEHEWTDENGRRTCIYCGVYM